jgi:hypothetical protein
MLCWQAMMSGVPIVFVSDPSRDLPGVTVDEHEYFMQQVKAISPTVLLGMAHFWTTCYRRFHEELRRRVVTAFPEMSAHQNHPSFHEWTLRIARSAFIYEDLLEEERQKFGNRLLTQGTGGSLTSQDVLDWMTDVFASKTTSGSSQVTPSTPHFTFVL